MRYLVISDIHGNLEALEAVLAHAEGIAHTLVLGDVIGYGADPNAVVDRLREIDPLTIIRGNHDKVGTGLETADGFNYVARQAIEWTAVTLTDANRDWVAALPHGPVTVDETVQICHGSPCNEDEYIFDEFSVRRAFAASGRTLCLFGHTHVPAAFTVTRNARAQAVGPPQGAIFELKLAANLRYLVNCGAVGQPRDGDPRASYGIVDTDARTVTVMRVQYDVARAQAKIRMAGLPDILAERLAVGR